MNLRQFLSSIPAAILAPFCIAKPAARVDDLPPCRSYPWHDGDSVVGLWAQSFDYDTKQWGEPYLFLSEFDEYTQTWQGQYINNARRNKFWGRKLTGTEKELLVLNQWECGERFFKNQPNTDWSIVWKKSAA